jgi:hypothetical protein
MSILDSRACGKTVTPSQEKTAQAQPINGLCYIRNTRALLEAKEADMPAMTILIMTLVRTATITRLLSLLGDKLHDASTTPPLRIQTVI